VFFVVVNEQVPREAIKDAPLLSEYLIKNEPYLRVDLINFNEVVQQYGSIPIDKKFISRFNSEITKR
jgi:hypothetical protein